MFEEIELAKLEEKKKDSFMLFSRMMGTYMPYNFVTNAVQMILPENKDLFRGHLLVLFLDIEVSGIFSFHLSGLKKKIPH